MVGTVKATITMFGFFDALEVFLALKLILFTLLVDWKGEMEANREQKVSE